MTNTIRLPVIDLSEIQISIFVISLPFCAFTTVTITKNLHLINLQRVISSNNDDQQRKQDEQQKDGGGSG